MITEQTIAPSDGGRSEERGGGSASPSCQECGEPLVGMARQARRHPACAKRARMRRYLAKPETKARRAEYWQTLPPEQIKAYHERYRASGRNLEASRRYSAKPEAKARALELSKSPERRAYRAQWQSRRRAVLEEAGWVKREVWEAVKAQPCRACGAEGPSDVDHVVPLSRGGLNTEGNVQPLCRICNSSKNDLTWTEWRASGRPGVPEPLRWHKGRASA